MNSITESDSNYDNLEKMSVREVLEGIHNEDKKVLPAIEKVIPQIEKLVTEIVPRVKKGGGCFMSVPEPADGLEFWMRLKSRQLMELVMIW